MQNKCCVNGCFLKNSSSTHEHWLLTKMILRNFISLRAFTVCMQFEISFRSIWPKFHFAWTHVNTNNEVTLHRSQILPRSEISNWFEFIQVSYKRALWVTQFSWQSILYKNIQILGIHFILKLLFI